MKTTRTLLAAAMVLITLTANAQQPEVDIYGHLPNAWKTYLDNGGNVNTANADGNTPLMLAGARNAPKLMKIFLEHGADVNARNKIGRTPLMFAAGKSPEMCQWLLDASAELDAVDEDDLTALHYSLGHEGKGQGGRFCESSFDKTAFWLLLEKGLDINARTKQGENPLYLAIQNKNVDETFIRKMLDAGAEVNVRTMPAWETPLFKALQRGNTDMCMMLLDAGAKVNIYNIKGKLPVFFAAEFWDGKLIDKFLECGSTLDDVGRDGDVLLHAAARAGDLELVKRILDTGVDVNTYSKYGLTALICALMENHQHVAKYLLEQGAGFEEKKQRRQSDHDSFVYAALQNAVMHGDLELCKFLVKKGARFFDTASDRQTFLNCAVINGDPNLCRYMYTFNPKPDVFSANAQTGRHYAPLHLAGQTLNHDIAVFLISKEADVNLRNRHGHTPMIYAVLYYPVSSHTPGRAALPDFDRRLQRFLMLMLKDAGADFTIKNNNGHTLGDYLLDPKYYAAIPFSRKYFSVATGIYRTADVPDPIHIAAMMGRLEEVKTRIKDGTDINLADADGDTILHFAVRSNKPEICEYLLEAGADVSARAIHGGTPIHYAAAFGHAKLIPLLVKHGANVNCLDEESKSTPLHWAVDCSQGTCVQALVKSGADMALVDSARRTPFGYALEYRKESYCKYFCKNGFDINKVVRENSLTAISPFYSRLDALRLLKELGMDFNTAGEYGYTLLHRLRSEPEMVRFLVENGADVTIRDNKGKLPSDIGKDAPRDDRWSNRIRRNFGIQ